MVGKLLVVEEEGTRGEAFVRNSLDLDGAGLVASESYRGA